MRTLFWKIFAWFGAAQLLIAVALYGVALTTQRGFDRGLVRSVGASLEARAQAAAVALEVGGPSALRAAWELHNASRRGSRRSGFGQGARGLFASPPEHLGSARQSSAGVTNPPKTVGELQTKGIGKLSGGADEPHNGPEDAPKEANGLQTEGTQPQEGPEMPRRASFVAIRENEPRVLAGPNLPLPAQKAVLEAWNRGEGFENSGGLSFLARRVETTSGGRYVAVTPLRMRVRGFSPLGDLLRPDGNMTLRFSVLALLMGAFCWGLALYVSDPAAKLSRATGQLASGVLSVRVGAQMGRRRDELADLGRDFDAMAERIEELVLGQRRLLSDISHELRSPLARLNVALELAGDGAPPSSQAFLDRIGEESAELDALIGGLLSLQRLEARDGQIQKTPLDLAQLVARVAADVGFEAQNGQAEVKVVRLDACEIKGNAELLLSALQNVARNAILHGAGQCVQIALERKDSEALIWVRDFGSGVPDEALDQLFEPFFRVAQARDRQSGGTGLGLSITRRAVEVHGGTVRAFNATGGGLRVEIRLPLEQTT